MRPKLHRLLTSALLATVLGGPAALADSASETADPHAMHRQMMMESREVHRVVIPYEVPSVQLVRQDGQTVDLATELADDRAVVLTFIYTTCTTICPLSSQVLSVLQEKLGAERTHVHLVSISIDPEQDTPARLREYASRFHAGDGWQHYTGTVQASKTAQVAFGAYRGDKMSHTPLTLVRRAGGGSWVRLEGFASADDILAEIRGTSGWVAAH